MACRAVRALLRANAQLALARILPASNVVISSREGLICRGREARIPGQPVAKDIPLCDDPKVSGNIRPVCLDEGRT